VPNRWPGKFGCRMRGANAKQNIQCVPGTTLADRHDVGVLDVKTTVGTIGRRCLPGFCATELSRRHVGRIATRPGLLDSQHVNKAALTLGSRWLTVSFVVAVTLVILGQFID
jgi:hypothetical protein